MTAKTIAALLKTSPEAAPAALAEAARAATTFEDLISLATVRKRLAAAGLPAPPTKVRLAIVGGYSFYPLRELIVTALYGAGMDCELFVGEYDSYTSEILDEGSALYVFRPDLVLVMPSARRCRYVGGLADSREAQRAEVDRVADELLALCRTVHERTSAEVLLANFMLPATFDVGPLRVRTLGAEWTFKKAVNLALGLAAPAYVHVCDLEFLAARLGGIAARDERMWFESKQPASPTLLVHVAHEVAHLASMLRRSAKKVLVLDLDNTLWGGVVGDDGLDGIEIGDTSARGEAFKAFQAYIATLKARGVLLGVCSKNDHARAAEAFEKHPEMVLRMGDFVSFKANWNPKSDNLRQMAADLDLGLDSFVFVDDNPAEIDIVRQFAPEVMTILLGPDPTEYVNQLADCRAFEPRSITREDSDRTAQYQREAERRELAGSATDMASYLRSLEMVALVKTFEPNDVPRIAQLINKSNQFNLTTRRRTEAEVTAIIGREDMVGLTIRLADRFGDHGLIAVVILAQRETTLEVDTWLMSCRVLKRQVEEETVNQIMRVAVERGVGRVRGAYLPTAKNGMVEDLYPRMGFSPIGAAEGRAEYEADPTAFVPTATMIRISRGE